MIRYFFAVAALFLALFQLTTAQVKTLPGNWSGYLSLNGNTNFGVSESMRGTAEEFINDMEGDYNNSKYPFGDDNTISGHLGIMLSYRFDSSNISLYYYWNYTRFEVDQVLRSANMSIFMNTVGVEYTFGNIDDIWNTFVRGGVNFNMILGEAMNWGWEAEISPIANRFGFETEVGGRFNIPSTPISLELAAGYANVNLLGKKYIKPEYTNYPEERALNDAANPDEPGDHDRAIDFISLRGGIRLWF